ncbi:Transmembrane amino acid transporter-like protein 9 [Elsinoe fawcettii]|nr:Transmembrane amino acid transporter-like protein 9 [Elsinoe fawcettii]
MPSGQNSRQPIPTSWADYERGGRRDSSGSSSSRVHFPEEDATAERDYGTHPRDGSFSQNLRRRRSSMSMRINTLRNAGGVNSIDNFARSWTRAGLFHEVTPGPRPSFRITDAEDDTGGSHGTPDVEEASPQERRSLLRSAFEAEGRRTSDNVIVEEDGHPSKGSWTASEGSAVRGRPSARDESIFQVDPQLQSVFGGSYGTSYGSVTSRLESSPRHPGRLSRPSLAVPPTSVPTAHVGPVGEEGEQEPLLVKQVEEDDGKIVNVVVGQSTLPQTIFNSVNVLIGVGLLALPLAMKYSGWVIGLVFLLWAAIVTQYTAKILAKCLDVDSSLITFADLALVSFGHRARLLTSILFCAELLGACVALVVLFADSLDALIPGLNVTTWKIICGLLLIPLSFLPLRLLSFSSVLGIVSCTTIVLAVFIDGLLKPTAPGSLRSPMSTPLFPTNWATIPISFGLLMSPWGGHSVFPNIYRDMRHPYKYRRAVNTTYVITSLLDVFMAVIGLLMFGNEVRDEITSNILLTEGYPAWISVLICVGIAVIPLTKIPLNARPIISTIEVLMGLDVRGDPPSQPSTSTKLATRRFARAAIKVVTTIIFVLLAIVLPSFDTIMSLVGSVACFSICVILPLAFHLKLFGKEIPRVERWVNWVLIVVSTIMAVVSTVFNCLPLERLGLVE